MSVIEPIDAVASSKSCSIATRSMARLRDGAMTEENQIVEEMLRASRAVYCGRSSKLSVYGII
jgi:hypothetical protein